MGKRKKKGRGHYCRECGRMRPNEKFSGKGHRKHICKDCNKKMKKQKKKEKAEEFSEEHECVLEGILPVNECPYYGGWGECFCEESFALEKGKSNEVTVLLPAELRREMSQTFGDGAEEKHVNASIALSLYITKAASLERAAYIADVDFTVFMDFLQSHNIPWEAEDNGVDTGTEKSIDDLLRRVDFIAQQEELEED